MHRSPCMPGLSSCVRKGSAATRLFHRSTARSPRLCGAKPERRARRIVSNDSAKQRKPGQRRQESYCPERRSDSRAQPARSPLGRDAMTELPWIKSYPKGVRWNAELPTMPLQQILEDFGEKMGRQAGARVHGPADQLSRAERPRQSRRQGIADPRCEAGDSRRPLPSQHAALRHRVLRHHEGWRYRRELLAARCRAGART